MNVCPKQAISMKPDEDGFLYPVIDEALCVECGLCTKACAFQNVPITADEPLATYAAINRNQVTLFDSSSGGVFAALASLVFEKDGVVFGCAFNGDMKPEHICVDNPADMKRLQGSKYVQSDVKNTYAEAQKYLKEGRHVLYTGTPCQIAGLKSCLGKDYSNLTTADLVCHGVPSAAFFKGYIAWLEEKLNGKITVYKFRDKSKVGMGLVGKVTFQKSGKSRGEIVYFPSHYYYYYFLHGDIYRDSCYECKYAGGSRQGDFTMGDWFGIEESHPEIETRNGVSVLLVNSEKGMALIGELSELLNLTKSTFEQARVQHDQLRQPAARSDRREAILQTWREGGYQAVADEYYKANRKRILISRIKMMVPQPVKRTLKRLLGRG